MPLTIKLVRHGEFRANTGEVVAQEVGDHAISLSDRGREQARRIGADFGPTFVRRALIYLSPYPRTRETLDGILAGCGLPAEEVGQLRVYVDPRLREWSMATRPRPRSGSRSRSRSRPRPRPAAAPRNFRG